MDKCSVSVVCTLQIVLNSMGLGGGSLTIYLILCLHCYFSLMLCIYLTKIMLILPQLLFSL